MSKVKVTGEKERVGGNIGKAWPEQTFLWLFRIYVWIWMLLLIVVQPFYCRDGYSTIGSDKYLFLTGACKAFALGVSDCIRILPQCRKERQSQVVHHRCVCAFVWSREYPVADWQQLCEYGNPW